jgi:hypothetical protein
MPTVLFPVAAPLHELTLDEVAAELEQFEYVYLHLSAAVPVAKIPTKAVPAAEGRLPAYTAVLATALTSPAKVYLFLAEGDQSPILNIATVPEGNGVALLLAALKADGPKTLVALTLNVYAVQLVSPVTETGEVAPDPALDSGQETAVKLLIAPPPTQAGAVNVTQA